MNSHGICTCPPIWHGVIPPACMVHNPPKFTTTTTTGEWRHVPTDALLFGWRGLACRDCRDEWPCDAEQMRVRAGIWD
jgi:hypothetical protein